MKFARQFSPLIIAATAICWSAWAQGPRIDYDKIEILTEKIAPNL